MNAKEIDDWPLPMPFSTAMIIVGASGSGKSRLVRRLLLNLPRFFEFPPRKILYCYGVYQPLIDELEDHFMPCNSLGASSTEAGSDAGFTSIAGLPSESDLKELAGSPAASARCNQQYEHSIVIIDDLQNEALNSETVSQLFVKYSHHFCQTVVLVMHNMFESGKFAKLIRNNAHHVILFKNLKSQDQVECFARQAFGRQAHKFLAAYEDATSAQPGTKRCTSEDEYLWVDLSNTTRNFLYRLRTNLFNSEEEAIIYV